MKNQKGLAQLAHLNIAAIQMKWLKERRNTITN